MAQTHLTPRLARVEDAGSVLFCPTGDTCALLNPRRRRHEALKRLSDSEILALALSQRLRGVESERSFLRDCERFLSHLSPGVIGYAPSSFHRRARKLRCFLEPPRRAVAGELAGDPETMTADSTLLEVLRPRQVKQSAMGFEGAAWTRWGSFALYGVKPRSLRSTSRVPLSYELTAANIADALLVEELLSGASLDERGVARRLFGDLAYKSGAPRRRLAESGVLLPTEGAGRRPATRRRIEVRFAHLKRAFGLGETLATTLVGLALRLAAKAAARTYGLYANGVLGRPQGRIKELWA